MSVLMSSLSVLFRSLRRHNQLSRSRLITQRKCKNISISWKLRGKNVKGIVVTGASAATCALVYFTHKSQEGSVLSYPFSSTYENALRVIRLRGLYNEHTQDQDVSDLFYYVGFEDDWLACSLSTLVFQSKPIYDSSAYIKQNIAELLSPWEQSHSDDPWVLLQLTKSGNFWVRQMGVACLANKIDWEAYKYRNISQACDYRTVIGLARYPHADDSYFLPQPKVCQSENDILTDIQDLVNKMPCPESIQSSIAFYRDLALQKEILFQKDPLAMDFLTLFYTVPGEEEKKKYQVMRYCLQALEAYTAVETYALNFVHLHGLALLQRLHEEFKENWIQMYILTILNNLSLASELGKDFVRSGWIQELRKWSKSENTTFSVMALTVLANLDRDWIGTDLYKNMILVHPTKRNSQPVRADIVLVHGLRGGAVKTWRQRDVGETDSCDEKYSDCWPKDWLSSEFQGVRIISVGYNSTVHQWGDQCPYDSDRRTLEGRSSELMEHLLKAGVGDHPIIWMGHSMGGLLIKEMLCLSEENSRMKRILENTKGIVMYSVPHKGSPLVDTMMYAKYVLFPSVEVQEMSTYSLKLKNLQEDFLRIVSSNFIPCLSFGENIKTEFGKPFPSVLLVSSESSDPGIGQYIPLPTNHIDTCKPRDKDDPIYLSTLSFLQSIIKCLR